MSYEDHIDRTIELQTLNINYPVGCKVVIKGANEDMYRVGTRTGHTFITKANQLEPIITFDNGEEIIKLGGIMKRYNDNLVHALDKLTGIQQWNVMANNYFLEDPEIGETNE